jgi:hypothetical protein
MVAFDHRNNRDTPHFSVFSLHGMISARLHNVKCDRAVRIAQPKIAQEERAEATDRRIAVAIEKNQPVEINAAFRSAQQPDEAAFGECLRSRSRID